MSEISGEIFPKQVDFASVGSLLEMLVVFRAAPVAAPAKAERGEILLAEVFFIYFVRKDLVSVHKLHCC